MDNAKNFAKVIVSIGYDAAAVSIALSVGEGTKLPTAPFNAVWYNSTDYNDPTDDPKREIVRVTNNATDTLTITRAQEGTSATTKNDAGKIYKMIAGLTAKTINTDIPALITTAFGKLTVDVFTTTLGQNTFTTSQTIVKVLLVIINYQPLMPADFDIINSNTKVQTKASDNYPAGLGAQIVYLAT